MKNACYLTLCILFTSLYLTAQDPPIIASLNIGYEARVIGSVGNSIIFHDDRDVYVSNGTTSGTKIIGELALDEVVLHPRTSLKGKYYFVLGGEEITGDSVRHSLVEVDPTAQTMTRILSNQKKITGLIDYNAQIYFGVADHPVHSSAYLKMNPSNYALQKMFEITENGVEDAIRHKGLIHLILKSPSSGTYLAKSNGGSGLRNISANRINMTSAGDKLYFWHLVDGSRYTLYVTEGTEQSTLALKDDFKRNSAFNYSFYQFRDIAVLGDRIYFNGQDVNGNSAVSRLWTSDGTIAGTKELFINGNGVQAPAYFTVLSDKIYFKGTEVSSDIRQTIMVVPGDNSEVDIAINVDTPGNEIKQTTDNIIAHQGTLCFSALTTNNEVEQYTKDANSKNITKVTDILEPISYSTWHYTSTGDNLFFFLINSDRPSQLRLLDLSLSSTQESSKENLVIYPNPTNSRLNIAGAENLKNVVISNNTGMVVKRYSELKDSHLDVETLEPGLYFLKVGRTEDYSTARFIKY